MDSLHLETLVRVAEKGSFVAAANDLGITATAVAQRIRSLEAEIGVGLVARSGRTVRLSEAGHAVMARSREVLRQISELRTAALGGEIVGELRVGAIATALTGLFPQVLERLTERHAGLDLYLEPGTSAGLYDRVVSGALDVAALVRPSFDMPKAMSFHLWRREKLVLLVAAEDRRSDVPTILRTSPFIRYDRRQWGGRLAASFLDAIGIAPKERFELDALDAIAMMVARGLGVSLVPDWAGPWPERVRRMTLPEPAPVRELGFVQLANSPRTHLVRVLIESSWAVEPPPQRAAKGCGAAG
ncbi:MAG TPA: LysR family transcriptional regulator [Aurantimonas sp.]|nr:LysR family transcriptional regulator [Aurantimonas sp.]